MSDYERSRYAQATEFTDTGGGSGFWVLLVVVALGALVLLMSLAGTATVPVEEGAEVPAITPAEPEASGAGTTTVE